MSVLIATPAYGGVVHVDYMNAVYEILRSVRKSDLLVTKNDSNVCKARNNIVATFMASPYKTLAFIDADVAVERNGFLRLLTAKADVRGAAVAMKTQDHTPFLSCWYEDGGKMVSLERDAKTKPFECAFLGAAVMLIERRVFEAFYDDEDRRYHDPTVGDACAIFENVLSNGNYLTEDYGFCAQARAKGFSIVCDPAVVTTHYGTCRWRT